MARYNTVSPTASITTTATVTTPNQGLFTTFGGTGPYTVTLADPRLFSGTAQTFFNTSGGVITLTVATYSGPTIKNNATSATTLSFQNNTAITLTSNGTDYFVTGSTSFGLTNNTLSSSTTVTSNTLNWCDTTSAAFTLTLPASPIQGDIVRVVDVSSTFNTNNLTIGRNGNPIQGDAANMTVATQGAAFDLIFYNASKGWRLFTI